MFALIIALVVGYFVIQVVRYFVHWALHQENLGRMFQAHKEHHKDKYPPEAYLFDGRYRQVSIISQPFWYYLPGALTLVGIVFTIFPLYIAISLTIELIIISWANTWLHQKLHVSGHWLEKYSWFHHLRALHWHHHIDKSKNIGIFSWFADKLFHTYQEPITNPSYLPNFLASQRAP